MSEIIDGRQVAHATNAKTKQRVADFQTKHGRAPGLATVLVGSDPASEVYVRHKRAAAASAGIEDFHRHLTDNAGSDEVEAAVGDFVDDPRVSGILLQLPLPPQLDSARFLQLIPPVKDVDGLTPVSQGLLASGRPGLRPCTPSGVIELLDSADVPIAGMRAVVVGRSELVGRPMAQLLIERDATTTVAHSRTRDLAQVTREADILVAAAGVQGLITARHIKPGAAVIDVGIHRTALGLSGDVCFAEVCTVAGWITPVPGGVGPMTIAMLLSNTVDAALAQTAEETLP